MTRTFTAADVAGHELAIGPNGSAIAVVRTSYGALHAVHQDPTVRQWQAPIQLAVSGAGENRVLVGPSGDATVLWIAATGTSTCALRVSHYSAGTGSWGEPTDLISMSRWPGSETLQAAQDATGNIFTAWAQPVAQDRNVIYASRYSTVDQAWSTPLALSPVGWAQPALRVVADADGNASVAWSHSDGASVSIHASRYLAQANGWQTPVQVSEPGERAFPSDLAVDTEGNVTAVWPTDRGVIRAARYVAATGRWSPARDVSRPPQSAFGPQLAVDPGGDVTAVWMSRPPGQGITYVMGARYQAATDVWTAPVDVERRGDIVDDLDLVTDRYGNVTIVWTRFTNDDDVPFVHALRYTPTTGRATPIAVLSDVEARYPRIAVNPEGSVLVTWSQSRRIGGSTRMIVEGTDWVAMPGAPSLASVRVSDAAVTVGVSPPVTLEPLFSPTNYEYSTDGGSTWRPRIPPSTVSPIRIAGLTNGVIYTVLVRAVNAAGPGAASVAAAATPAPAPDAPTGLHVQSQIGDRVRLAWTPPSSGVAPTTYVVEGGLLPGEVMGSLPTGSLAPEITFVAPTGALYVRVHAIAGSAWSDPSNEIRVFVNVPAPPSPPANLLGLVNGSTIALSWTNTYAGGVPRSLWLSVSGSITAALPLSLGETFTFAPVPPGTYTLAVVAANASGVSAPSNPVTLTFPMPCTGVPLAPTNLQAWKVGSTIFLSWSPPASGPAVASYTVIVGGAYVGSFPIAGRAVSGTVGPGTYVLSVSAGNACGAGPATPAQTVVVP